ncbi:MAG: hypothetical protein DRI93_04395 [Aquificota bacterium]|nr:MAG: hypothetical protein DRI93_04395 [Aquificota bacterium]
MDMVALILFVVMHIEGLVILLWIRKRGVKAIIKHILSKSTLTPKDIREIIEDLAEEYAPELIKELADWIRGQFLTLVHQDKAYKGRIAEWLLSSSHPLVEMFFDTFPEARRYIRKHPDFAFWLAGQILPRLMQMGLLSPEGMEQFLAGMQPQNVQGLTKDIYTPSDLPPLPTFGGVKNDKA